MAEVPLPTPTQAPVPSTDIRNAVFAGAKLDEEVTGTGEFYTDRLGVKRLTNTGRNNQFDAAQLDRANRFEQFLLSSGYVFLGDYEDGPFQFSARNQYIRYNNQYYRLNAATDVGFTTTGTDATSFANDVTHFVLMDGDTLRQNLGSGEGFALVGQVSSFTALRSVVPSYEGQSILLRAHPVGWAAMSHGPVGGGEFISRRGSAEDDGGYICVPTGQSEYYWQRIPKNPGKVCATEFGLYDGAALDDIWTSAINYCIKNSIGYFSTPSLGPAGYTLVGGLEFINSTNGLIIEGPGMGTKGNIPVITHTGANVALTFKRTAQAQSLFNAVILKNFTAVGNALATAFVRFSDFYGGSVFDSVIRDYTTGTAIDVYNDKGWTEVIRVDNVVVRTSQRGIWFHSNPASTDDQTLSFYGASISNFGFQHGITAASYGIYVGDGSRADNLYNCDIDMMGWWEVGGNSTALYAADKARVDGFANFRYDGFAASPITSSSQPCRLVRKAGLTGYVKLNCKNYKHNAGLGLTAGVTQLTIRPWLAIAEAVAGVATPHPTLPAESIISVPGMKCKLTGTLFKGQNSVISVVGMPPWHRYKVTTRCDLSSTSQQQYIVNIPNGANAGITTRTDSVPAVTTTTTISGGLATSTSTAKNKNFEPVFITNAGNLPDNTFSETNKQGFDIHLDGTQPNVINDEYPVSIEIEAID
ncbi:hypothetical protein ACQF58_07795 [Klebsiella pneumoniae]|uniref:hypothetical protein n=1 Tax=Klebsiella pneumoniae complex TaxID=3390273 RepID=UPI0017887995|nr:MULTISPECIES: hypothetical protein [Klebsiella]HDH1292927.1 hypothetical protein [Klebsiella quasipneumoniae subsp. similipneumoniae]EKV5510786.1 hypothetical protein [Klebsiella pneumoniae]EKW8247325.1 hypothetical protein [Klebsiella pneumoniae]EKW9225050.1 hypothetical protein [Klebsiella pneumoniae]EKZ6813486.1 hypothetical protein [Klebsiella pneumoniae]